LKCNKRTAVTLLLLLLERSGYDLHPLPGEDIFDAIEEFAVDVANGQMEFSGIEEWLRARII